MDLSSAKLRIQNLGSTSLPTTSTLATNQHDEDSDVGCSQLIPFSQRRSISSLLCSAHVGGRCKQHLCQRMVGEVCQ